MTEWVRSRGGDSLPNHTTQILCATKEASLRLTLRGNIIPYCARPDLAEVMD